MPQTMPVAPTDAETETFQLTGGQDWPRPLNPRKIRIVSVVFVFLVSGSSTLHFRHQLPRGSDMQDRICAFGSA